MLCAECLMRRRVAALTATGSEPTPLPTTADADEGLPPVFQAVTFINGVALCAAHFTECVKPQAQSGLVSASGQPILLGMG